MIEQSKLEQNFKKKPEDRGLKNRGWTIGVPEMASLLQCMKWTLGGSIFLLE
jgi:hypothetical protein